MTGKLQFQDNVTQLNAANLNLLCDGERVNLVKNAAFLAWTLGASYSPDGWVFVASGGSIAQDSANNLTGDYCAKITKNSSDTTHSWLYSKISDALLGYIQGRTVTVGALVKAPIGSVRCIINDGVGTEYGDFNETSDYEIITVRREIDASATKIDFGIEMHKPATGSHDIYVDHAFAFLGAIVPNISANPIDFSLFLTGYQDETSFIKSPAGFRVVPFKHTWTAAGGGATESDSFSYVSSSPDIRPVQTFSVHGNCISCVGPNPEDVFVSFSSLSSSGFTINARSLSGTNFSAGDITVRGFAIVRGFNDWESVWGGY